MALAAPTEVGEPGPAEASGGGSVWHWVVLALIFAIALALRLWGIDHGLPAVFNPDEASHFVPRAVRLHQIGGFDPGYFLNPPLITYVFYVVFAIWFGGSDGVAAVAASDPAAPYLVARVVVAVMGAIGVVVVYLVGRVLIDRRAGLVAATLMAVSFLPVHWSHFATNDVAAMVAGTVSLLGSVIVLKSHHLGGYVLAGVGLGLAIGTKYTAGVVILALLAAAIIHWRDEHGRAVIGLLVAGACSIAAFLLAVPTLVTDSQAVLDDLLRLNPSGGTGPKIGQAQESGHLYYGWVLTWGIGWPACALAVVGAAWTVIRNRTMAAVLLPAPILYIAFMGGQAAFFGRWLLPVLPFVLLLAALGAVRLTDAITERRGWSPTPILALVTVAMCLQSVIHVVHMNTLLGRTDTREEAVDWMRDNLPVGTNFVNSGVLVRPMIDDDPSTRSIESRWQLTSLNGNQSTVGARLAMLDQFEQEGWCWVSASSLFYDRLFVDEHLRPEAAAYYRELEERGEIVFHASPYRPGADPVPFNFDWATNLYPFEFEQPGGEVTIYLLHGGACA
jgi:4-amino-4-deoxy-L-arabinose transferase-like glycosyltransferase